MPEDWRVLGGPEQKREIAKWEKEKPFFEKARNLRALPDIEMDDQDYIRCMAEARQKYELKEVPGMPIVEIPPSGLSNGRPLAAAQKIHVDHTAPKGYNSFEKYCMIHIPISIKEAMNIPKAKEALDNEWNELAEKGWDVNKVRPKADVIKESLKDGISVHFGKLMDLCHLKHAELEAIHQRYKGRVVFRGDQVKDETGSFAVFTEQGASASNIAASKFLDALSRMPGMSGEEADGVKAYTQCLFKDAAKLLGLKEDQFPKTYISLPANRRPKWWDKIEDPVVELKINLYGHPLGGLIWEKHLENKLKALGWEAVPSW